MILALEMILYNYFFLQGNYCIWLNHNSAWRFMASVGQKPNSTLLSTEVTVLFHGGWNNFYSDWPHKHSLHCFGRTSICICILYHSPALKCYCNGEFKAFLEEDNDLSRYTNASVQLAFQMSNLQTNWTSISLSPQPIQKTWNTKCWPGSSMAELAVPLGDLSWMHFLPLAFVSQLYPIVSRKLMLLFVHSQHSGSLYKHKYITNSIPLLDMTVTRWPPE